MTRDATPKTWWDLLEDARLELGCEDLVGSLRSRHPQRRDGDESRARFESDWRGFIADVRIRIGTLLKTDTVSFLLGAGASVGCGGVLVGSEPWGS
jgi:hypothetical protein